MLLLAELVSADETPNVTDGALKDAAVTPSEWDTVELLQSTYLTVAGVFDLVKSMLSVNLSASLK